MKEKKFVVYYDDQVNEAVCMFSADTLEECITWINENLEGMTPLDDEHPCSEYPESTSRLFCYDVYEGGMIAETEEEDGEAELQNPCYTSGYYYAD